MGEGINNFHTYILPAFIVRKNNTINKQTHPFKQKYPAIHVSLTQNSKIFFFFTKKFKLTNFSFNRHRSNFINITPAFVTIIKVDKVARWVRLHVVHLSNLSKVEVTSIWPVSNDPTSDLYACEDSSLSIFWMSNQLHKTS